MLTAEKVKNMLTPQDIERFFVEVLHADSPATDSKGNLLFSTEICHGGDSPHKLVYFVDTKSFYCWTHCHAIDLFEITKRRLHLDSFKEAFDRVVSFFALKDENSEPRAREKITDDWDLLQRIDDLSADLPEDEYVERVIPEALLDTYSPPCAPQEWIDDGIDPDVMAAFGIRVDASSQKIIIPHRNKEGKLIGIRGRSFDPFESQFAKYAPVTLNGVLYNFPTGKYLFGLSQNAPMIRRMRKVVIYEGEKSVLQSASFYGIGNSYCVATCGSTITEDQIDLLLELGVEEVVLGYDRDFLGKRGDEDVKEYEKKLYRVIQPLLPYFNVYVLFDYDHITGYKDSPTDKGREVFEALWKKKIFVPPIGGAEIKEQNKKRRKQNAR